MSRPQRRLAAVIGSPVAHSLSPIIHQAAFDAAEVDWAYVAFEVAPGSAAAALDAMRVLGIAGLSVTMPHKTDVFHGVDRVEPAAAALRSVNTVSWERGELVGSSTDGAGFVASLTERGVTTAGAICAVLGAGGAARSVIDALGRAGAADIVIVNRDPQRADAAAELATVARVGTLDDVIDADIVVNATSVGMGTDEMPCDPARLRPDQIAADLVYHPIETAWLRTCAANGLRTVDGLGMLIHQAALQQLAWLGHVPDVTVMRTAAEAALR